METPVYSTLFVELDALLDTRLAILTSFGEEALKFNLTKNYFSRKHDFFIGINQEEYKIKYLNRDKSILKNSLSTELRNVINQFIQKTLLNRTTTPYQFLPKIIVNLYPYQLEEKEKQIILSSIIAMTHDLAPIEIVYLPYLEITPMYVKKNLSVLILYNYLEWLELQSKLNNFPKTICPEVTLLGPCIYFILPNNHTNTSENPFGAIEHIASPLISLKLLPIHVFSIAIDQNVVPN
jgi:hypothetical protein